MPIAGILIISPAADGSILVSQHNANQRPEYIVTRFALSPEYPLFIESTQLGWKTPSMTGGSTALCVQGELDTPKAPRSGAYNNDSFEIKSTHYSKKKTLG